MPVKVSYDFVRVVTIANAADHFEALDAALGQLIYADKMQTPTVVANVNGGFDVSCASYHSITVSMTQRAAVASFLGDSNLPPVIDLANVAVENIP